MSNAIQNFRALSFTDVAATASALSNATPVSSAFDPLFSLPSSLWKASQPLQPYVAALKIAGTAAWKSKQKTDIQKKINRTALLVKILKTKAEFNPQAKETIQKRILKLRAEQKELRLQLKNRTLSFFDLPCLLFEHPGSNAWKSCTSLAGRVCSLCHHLSRGKGRKFLCKTPLATIAQIGCGTLSLLGTSFSLMKQIGAIEGTDAISRGIIGAAFAVQGIESCIIGYKSLMNLSQ